MHMYAHTCLRMRVHVQAGFIPAVVVFLLSILWYGLLAGSYLVS